ncbi:MAG TPA: hypothetical protein VFV34_19420 [Blastocatellia bacterium]|nr:hypothetical protein [Blastocatellia bacterium]
MRFSIRLVIGIAAAAIFFPATPVRCRVPKPPVEPLDLIRRFKIGMSYDAVLDALPRTAVRDVLSYNVTEESFLLSAEMPGPDKWTLSFTFETEDTPIRRPERLIEVRCSAMLSSSKQPFDSLVRKVSTSYGDPVKVDLAKAGQHQAGWAMTGGTTLLLEYSVLPSASIKIDAIVDFIIRSKRVGGRAVTT